MKLLIFALLFSCFLEASAKAPSSCVSLRGNGFRMAAHYGALAKIVEETGLPNTLIGGSSGALTMFITESIAMNQLLADDSSHEKASLLFKSVPEFLTSFTYQKDVWAFRKIIANPSRKDEAKALVSGLMQRLGVRRMLWGFWKYATSKTFRDIVLIKNSPYIKAVLHRDFIDYFQATNALANRLKEESDPVILRELGPQLKFRKKQIDDVLLSAQKFDAKSDPNIFFRPGLMSLEGMGKMFDRPASFYAGYNFTPGFQERIKGWLSVCSKDTKGLTFSEIEERTPFCGAEFRSLVQVYLSRFNELEKKGTVTSRAQDTVGKHLPSYVSTAIMKGESVNHYLALDEAYKLTTDPRFGDRFKGHLNDLRMGYFGSKPTLENALKRMRSSLQVGGRNFDFSIDFKTERAFLLGEITWLEAIKLSAAEPGQARPVLFSNDNQKLLSFGGWVDPNSAHLLKGLGCETVITVMPAIEPTNDYREQVIRALLSDATGFSELTGTDVAFGTSDKTSTFGVWRNYGNPSSSENRSLRAADGVYCVPWDRLDPIDPRYKMEKNFRDLFELGYHSQLVLNDELSSSHVLRVTHFDFKTRKDNVFRSELGRPLYNGCVYPDDE